MRDSRQPRRAERTSDDRDALRPLQGDRLRDELAEHDREVREDRERDANAMPAERGGSKKSESNGSPTAPMRMANTVMPTWMRPMNRTGSSMRRSAVFAPRPPPRRLLLEAHAARRDERVLGRDEERAPQHEEEHDQDVEKNSHAPSGAPVLGG